MLPERRNTGFFLCLKQCSTPCFLGTRNHKPESCSGKRRGYKTKKVFRNNDFRGKRPKTGVTTAFYLACIKIFSIFLSTSVYNKFLPWHGFCFVIRFDFKGR